MLLHTTLSLLSSLYFVPPDLFGISKTVAVFTMRTLASFMQLLLYDT